MSAKPATITDAHSPPARGRLGLGAIVTIILRSLRRHAFSTSITVLATALAVGLVMSVFVIQEQANRAFTGGDVGYDAVLGARGSKLQLVLNAVFHLETSPGNLPWSVYQRLKLDPQVELAIPYAVGDNYQGYRIVGTTTDLFTKYRFDGTQQLEFYDGGRGFDAQRKEAVIGSLVAQRTGLRVGSHFNPSHGVTHNEHDHHHHEDEYTVVGITKPTNSANDRVIWIPIDGIFRMEGHVLRGEGRTYTPKPGVPIPDEHKEVSAVMLRFKHPMAGARLDATINRNGKEATLAWPIAAVMGDLFNKIGWIARVLELVAYLVVLVSAAAILASIYNTINERRREFAILRALGARRLIVFASIVGESALIGLLGAVGGFALYGVILSVAAQVIRDQTGVAIGVWNYHPVMAWAVPGMVALGGLIGVVPALKAYATDVATNLAPHS